VFAFPPRSPVLYSSFSKTSSIGGKMFPDTEREIVMQETIMSRVGVDRVLKFAFELANRTEKKTFKFF
jgi:isocitrate/isopropylmalate dehydrogenase